MKITSVLVAFAAAALAPLAAAQNCDDPANDALLDQLTITSTIKRSTVYGGKRVVQTIHVKNTGTTAASGVAIMTAIPDDDLTFLKGRVPKAKVTLENDYYPTSGTVTIPAGKTLKATVRAVLALVERQGIDRP